MHAMFVLRACVFTVHCRLHTAVFLYSSFQLIYAALHQITLQNSFDLTHKKSSMGILSVQDDLSFLVDHIAISRYNMFGHSFSSSCSVPLSFVCMISKKVLHSAAALFRRPRKYVFHLFCTSSLGIT